MPRVHLTEDSRRNAALVDYINIRVGPGRQYRYDVRLAEALKINANTFSYRRGNPGRFGFDELCLLFSKTNISDKELCRIFGVPYRKDIS